MITLPNIGTKLDVYTYTMLFKGQLSWFDDKTVCLEQEDGTGVIFERKTITHMIAYPKA